MTFDPEIRDAVLMLVLVLMSAFAMIRQIRARSVRLRVPVVPRVDGLGADDATIRREADGWAWCRGGPVTIGA